MCGRTSLFLAQDGLEGRFDATVVADGGYTPRYNVAPGEPLEVLTNEAPGEIDRFHWGLVPSWADDPGEGLINARAETAPEKRSFGEAWESRPCLVPSTGFYEWHDPGNGPKTPYRIHRDREGPEAAFAMAGLWEVWSDGERELPCVTILTTEPSDLLEPIHDRMPVVLPRAAESEWLRADPDERRELCRPYPDDDLAAYEVSTRVNDPANDDPSVVEPAASSQAGLDEF